MGTATRAAGILTWGAGAFALGLYVYLVARACGPEQLGAGRRHSMAADNGIGTKGAVESLVPSSEASLSQQPTGASSSPPEPAVAVMPPARAGVETGDGPGGVYSRSFSFEGLENPHEAVLATTLDLWDSDVIKKLTLAEARALLQPAGLDPDSSVRGPTAPEPTGQSPLSSPAVSYDLSGDGLLLDRIGGLPTEVDVMQALDSPEVVQALEKYLVAQGIALEFALKKSKAPGFLEAKAQAERAREAALDGLYASLDGASAYRHWQLLGAIWRALDEQ